MRLPWLIPAALALLTAEARAQQELRWKLEPGETLHYVHENRQATTFNGQPGPNPSRSEAITWRVGRRDADGSVRITETIDRLWGTHPRGKDEQGPFISLPARFNGG